MNHLSLNHAAHANTWVMSHAYLTYTLPSSLRPSLVLRKYTITHSLTVKLFCL